MTDKRIGKRIKECREKMGFTQEQLAEKLGVSPVYVSTIERGITFPRPERLILILNTLRAPADAIFCDVLDYSFDYKSSQLSKELASLSPEDQKRILKMVELMIQEAKDNQH